MYFLEDLDEEEYEIAIKVSNNNFGVWLLKGISVKRLIVKRHIS